MPSKPLNVLYLIPAVILNGIVLFSLSTPWIRLVLGMMLLVPLVVVSAHLGLAEWFDSQVATTGRPRRFPLLRSKVVALIDEIKRLNWLVVDLDHGHRDAEAVKSDIEMCEQRMEALLGEIRRAAGQAAVPAHEGEEPPIEGAPPGLST